MLKNKDFLVLLIRLFLGYIFFSAGLCKLTDGNFGQLIGPPWLGKSLAKYDLALFAQVIAYCQVIFGALLLSQRFSTLGAILLVPMNICILGVTISQNWTGTPYVNAVFLTLNLLALIYEHQKFRFLVNPRAELEIKPVALDNLRQGYLTWAVLGSTFIALLAAPFNNTITNIFGGLTFLLAGLVVCLPSFLNNLERIVVALAISNMLIITAFHSIAKAPKLIMGNSLLLFCLLLVSLFLRYRRNRLVAVLPS